MKTKLKLTIPFFNTLRIRIDTRIRESSENGLLEARGLQAEKRLRIETHIFLRRISRRSESDFHWKRWLKMDWMASH